MLKRHFAAAGVLGLMLALVAGPVAQAEPANLYPHKLELREYINSGDYAKDVARVALKANKYLVKRIAEGARPGQKLAVVFDIDETTLTNLPHILENDFAYRDKIWETWVAAGSDRAIVPIQTIYDTAVRAKIDVFFVTGRGETDRAGTERNLREVGYDTWTGIYYKPADPGLATAAFKTETRKKIEAKGYVIVANIGDQESDLSGGHAERTFKLPNPFYLVN